MDSVELGVECKFFGCYRFSRGLIICLHFLAIVVHEGWSGDRWPCVGVFQAGAALVVSDYAWETSLHGRAGRALGAQGFLSASLRYHQRCATPFWHYSIRDSELTRWSDTRSSTSSSRTPIDERDDCTTSGNTDNIPLFIRLSTDGLKLQIISFESATLAQFKAIVCVLPRHRYAWLCSAEAGTGLLSELRIIR